MSNTEGQTAKAPGTVESWSMYSTSLLLAHVNSKNSDWNRVILATTGGFALMHPKYEALARH